MRLCSIASGSSGNCVYVGNAHTHLLVDTGISKKRIEAGLQELEIKGDELDGILITHEHSDHIQGLGVFCRKYEVPIYATAGTLEGIYKSNSLGKIPRELFQEIQADEAFTLGDITVNPFRISHDANEPTGYRMEHAGKAVAVATDLGMYDDYIIEKLSHVNAILLEANHDVHMLEVGPYPYPLKRRVLGDTGHLSNELSGRLLCDILHDGMQHILLGHLSKENNYAKLAHETVKLEISLGDNPYHGDDIPITIARRDANSALIEIS
jgi:Metal-dependent hydrolases of the beta-lactamase superfamily I